MMGHQEGFQRKLFYHQINLDQRVPQDHTLRKIQEGIDFDFIYGEVKEKGMVLFRRRGCGVIGSTVVTTGRGPIPLSSTKHKRLKAKGQR